ncbi:hypothetical protein MKW98_005337 [Papaver atlanticum]|uniref:Protein kinase domain-containing protein n=1 Tax=Papaver atlanticum TaxID=357466 RepID=A0AAD4X3X6_9MAGN|nr:hypothetical protein MKW98_005337 [Papaver atlanticum]
MMFRFKHANLVKLIGACKNPIMTIATELLLGMSLRKYLLSIRPKQLDIPVAIGDALNVACHGMFTANGVIHRFKTWFLLQALLIMDRGYYSIIVMGEDKLLLTAANQKYVKLADFGLAREESATDLTQKLKLIGGWILRKWRKRSWRIWSCNLRRGNSRN